jgi:hypothetical protein
MAFVVGAAGLVLIGSVLLDAFETIVLPRRVSRQFLLGRLFFRTTSNFWYAIARRMPDNSSRRENFLSYYGPLSLLMLLIAWAAGLILGFALLSWAIGSPVSTPEGPTTFLTDLYLSGGAFFTLGPSDVAAHGWAMRLLSAAETGIGLSFLALILAYLPVLYQAFSQRETYVSMLDEWAGSPPSAADLIRRLGPSRASTALVSQLNEWESWAAKLLETHLSYPILGFFRSQHQNQSWLAALTTILGTSALVLAGIDDMPIESARRTFAMARHAVVDLSQVHGESPCEPRVNRLPADQFAELRSRLGQAGLHLGGEDEAQHKLSALRHMYEPYANALAERLLMPLPPWLPAPNAHGNWQSSPLGWG